MKALEADSTDRSSLLSIGKVVERLKPRFPSISPSSLRFLEREGLVEPRRTPGGHRLYSPTDLDRILQIKEWQDQRLSLEEIRSRLSQLDALPDTSVLVEQFLAHALGGEHAEARKLISDMDDLGMPLPAIFGDILQPALYEIGNRWEQGALLVAQEKEVSELVRDLIAELSQRHDRWSAEGLVIVAACVKGERHELGLRMVAGALRALGYRVHYLGADVDHSFLADAIRLNQPDIVVLSVKLDPNLDQVAPAVAHIRDAARNPEFPILVGGEAVHRSPDHVSSAGAIPVTEASIEGTTRAIMEAIESFGNQGESMGEEA